MVGVVGSNPIVPTKSLKVFRLVLKTFFVFCPLKILGFGVSVDRWLFELTITIRLNLAF